MSAIAFSASTMSWARSSWSDSTMVIWAASSGSLPATVLPSGPLEFSSTSLRLSVTTPLSVVTALPSLPSRMSMKRWAARRFASSHRACARGLPSRLVTAFWDSVLSPVAAGPASADARGGSSSSDLLLHIDVRVHLVDEEAGYLGPDVLVLQQLAAGLGPVVGVQQLAVRPHREDGDEREEGREDDEDDR